MWTNEDLTLLEIKGISTLLREEAHRYNFWGKFKGNIRIAGTLANNDLSLSFSGMPIEVNNELSMMGMGNTMMLPTKKEYSGVPTYGSRVMKGREEEGSETWTHVHYNHIRHAVVLQDGEQEMLQEQALNRMRTEQPALSRYFANVENYNVSAAIYEGLSENLSASRDDGGLGLTVRYHPNAYYVSAAGAITKVCSNGYFPTSTQMDTASTNIGANSTFTINTTTLDLLAMKCIELKIQPIVTSGGDRLWLLIIHPMQAAILRTDTSWLAAQREAIGNMKGLSDNPIFNGTIGIYAGFAVQVDPIAVRGWDAANNNFLGLNLSNVAADVYTKEEKYNRRFSMMRTASTNRCAIVLGQSALGYVQKKGGELAFRTDDDDYQNWRGLCGSVFYGYSRLDQVDKQHEQYLNYAPASITSATNDGSLILMSYVAATNT